MRTLATYSIKGGVGKTTAAVNLAAEAARTGARVLLWDLDPQGAASWCTHIRAEVAGGARKLVGGGGELAPHVRGTDHPALHVVPSDLSLRHLDLHLDAAGKPRRRLAGLLAPVADRYDVAILDCPPGLTLGSESVFGAADALLVPVVPSTLSARTLEQLSTFLDGRSRPVVLPFFSIVDRRRRLQRELVEELAAGWPFLSAAIPNASAIEQMGAQRAAVASFAPGTPAARAFRALWSEVAARIWA